MNRIVLIVLFCGFIVATPVIADEVLPSVSKEDMSAYKNAFGQAVAESRRDENRRPTPSPKDESFGSAVSKAAREMREDITKDNKNFGEWVSKQRKSEKTAENLEKRGSGEARVNSPGGRPPGAGKPESAGKSNHDENSGKGKGK